MPAEMGRFMTCKGDYMNQDKGKLKQYIHDFWAYRDLLRLMVAKSVKLKYRRSVLGYLWSVLNPLMIMVVMTIVFSAMFGREIENFPVYLFCGQLLFNFMNSATHQSTHSITHNHALMKKTYVPKFVFTLAKVSSCAVDLVFSLAALLVVMIVTRAPFSWTMLLGPLVLLQLYLFTLGLSLFLAQACVFFKDVEFIYNAVTTAWMYLSAIFYPVESLPGIVNYVVVHFNPMHFYIAQFRSVVYAGTLPDMYPLVAGCVTALAMLAFGLWSFMRTEDDFILHI